MDRAESKQSSASSVSGKLLIIGILAVAFIAAGTSWWFRYSATHRTAMFWGTAVPPVIRDARVVEFWIPVNFHPELRDATLFVDDSEWHEISSARGLVHLRNALLEDHSFDWPPIKISADVEWTQGLRFLDGSTGVLVLFSHDFKFVRTPNGREMLSCEPIAKGLREMFAEFTAEAKQPAADGTSAAAPAR